MVNEQLKKPFSTNVLNVFETTELKFSIGLIPYCCFPGLNRAKNRFSYRYIVLHRYIETTFLVIELFSPCLVFAEFVLYGS